MFSNISACDFAKREESHILKIPMCARCLRARLVSPNTHSSTVGVDIISQFPLNSKAEAPEG